VPREPLRKALDAVRPEPVTGSAGTVAIFHSNVIHGSGHNLSSRDRRQLYVVYTPVANKALAVANPRPDHVRSTNCESIGMGSDTGILDAAREPKRQGEAATAT
jgi:ectoine hydroxylase